MMEGFKLIGWKAWYVIDDQTVIYKSNTNKWEDLPQEGIIIMKKYYDEDGKKTKENIASQEFYVLNNEMVEAMKTTLPNTVKLGTWIPDPKFNEIFDLGANDEEFIDKML